MVLKPVTGFFARFVFPALPRIAVVVIINLFLPLSRPDHLSISSWTTYAHEQYYTN